MRDYSILIVIPARGGSKGIPRKNIRNLHGRPLISYSIQTALSSKFKPDVVVTSDDDEIIAISKKNKANTIKRDLCDALDNTTLDPVIFKAYLYMDKLKHKAYDLVITLQPTSPLLKEITLDKAIQKMLDSPGIDTIISGTNDTHLTWSLNNNRFSPNYKERLNRQQLPICYKETGGFLITRPASISEKSRIGVNVEIFPLAGKEAIDIDTYSDWSLCEYYLKRKKVLLVVSGYVEIGLGHVYNTLQIANDLMAHEVIFLVDKKSKLAFDKISENNYQVYMQQKSDIVDDIVGINPDVIINDRLDTAKEYMTKLKQKEFKVINFEDLGDGAVLADLVINAIYPEAQKLPNHFFGQKYFLLRDEFLLTQPHLVKKEVKSVLLTFGGVDPNDFTNKTLGAIYRFSENTNIKIKVIIGFGYKGKASNKIVIIVSELRVIAPVTILSLTASFQITAPPP